MGESVSAVKRALQALDEMQRKVTALERAQCEPIAVVGAACRFPGNCGTPEAFWKLLADGADGVTEIPAERWNAAELYSADASAPGKLTTRWGGFVPAIDEFDADFWGISRREAEAMDPQQRMWLEVSWEALENAGLPAHSLSNSLTGVFAGVCSHDYQRLHYRALDRISMYSGTGGGLNLVAGRLSYLLNLQGPSISVDTACSSSLVAVHLACQSLRTGDSDLALAGGVHAMVLPDQQVCASKMRILAADGRVKAFDARADGFVCAEGCGVVVLKRLSDAIADRDAVWAVILGSAVNQDGRSAGMTAPSVLAQQKVIRHALRNGNVEPEGIGYVETHGTGTSLGDPIEVEALAEVYGGAGGEPCVLGAVKSNIGHAEAAAGVAGLIKAMMALRNEAIPPNLHFKHLNPNISLDGTRLVLADRLRPWPKRDTTRKAAVSSFGWSGTNAHMVLEEAPARPAMAAPEERVWLLPVSARSEKAARAQAVAWQEYLRGSAVPPLRDLCHTAGVRRSHHAYRLTAVGRTPEQMLASLESAAPVLAAGTAPGPVFVFPGQGGQWVGMGRELLRTEPVFGKVIEECGQAMARDLAAELEGDWSEAGIDRIQPLLFAVSAGLAVLWRSWGIEPSTVVGHSMGEVAAAYVAGGLELGDAVRIVCTRSLLLRRVTGQGAMAMVEKSRQQAEELAARSGGRISLAVENSPRSAVLAGDRKALEELGRELEERGEYFRWVQVEVASHSSQVDELLEELREQLGGITGRRLQVPMYSTVEERVVKGEELNGAYWVRNLREPVRFAGVVERLVGEGYRRYVEVSPHMVLGGAVREAGGEVVVGSLRRGEEERRAMLESLGELYASGSGVEWGAVNAEGECVRVPGYAWQRERYWLEDVENAFEWGEEEVAEHRVEGAAVLAGSGYVQLAAEAAGSGAITVEGMEWKRLLSVKGRRRVKVSLRGDRFAVYSEEAGEWVEHGGGRVTKLRADGPTGDKEAIEAARRRCGERIGAEAWYRAMSGKGLEYGGAHRGVEEAWLGNGEAVARVDGKRSLTGLLDSCFQVLGETSGTQSGLRVPVRADRIAVYGEVRGELWVWARAAGGEIDAIDDSGRTVIEVRGLELRALDSKVRDDWFYKVEWEPSALAPASPRAGDWLIVSDQNGVAFELAAALRARGSRCEILRGSALPKALPAGGIVFLRGLDAQPDCVAQPCIDVLSLVQDVARLGWRDARLVLVTRGLGSSALWGLGGVIAHELPQMRCLRIEFEGGDATRIADELLADGNEDQVRLKSNGARLVSRLMHCPVPANSPRIAAGCTYLITGGLGGIGLAVARWLTDRGARHIALAGRSAPSSPARHVIASLPAEVRTFQVDVSEAEEAATMLQTIEQSGAPLRGVFHAAGILDDGILLRLTPERLTRVLAPKAAGAWNLHRLTADLPLDHFVLFSSAASIMGAPGQGNYAAANSFLDALAHYRHACGLPALSVNWGPWSGIGLAAQDGRNDRLSYQGIEALSPEQNLRALEYLMAQSSPQVAVMDLALARWRQYYPKAAALPLFSRLGIAPQRPRDLFRKQLDDALPEQRSQLLEDHVRQTAALILRRPPERLDVRAVFGSLGLDSLMALELRNRLDDSLGLRLPVTLLWNYQSVGALAAHMLEALYPVSVSVDAELEALLMEADRVPVEASLEAHGRG